MRRTAFRVDDRDCMDGVPVADECERRIGSWAPRYDLPTNTHTSFTNKHWERISHWEEFAACTAYLDIAPTNATFEILYHELSIL